MANRSYLFATNELPSHDPKPLAPRIIGLSEWNYDIPLAFKLLLSANPQLCVSSIWSVPEKIAIIADYDAGLSRLIQFLDSLSLPQIRPLRNEAHDFLSSPKNRRRYILLECGEIFEMSDKPLAEQNASLQQEIQTLLPRQNPPAIPQPGASPPPPRGFFEKLFAKKPTAKKLPANTPDPIGPIDSLGLGNWSNILYFDINSEELTPLHALRTPPGITILSPSAIPPHAHFSLSNSPSH